MKSRPASCLLSCRRRPARFFDAQVSALERFFETGKPPIRPIRTLLTTGILDAAMTSHHRRGERIETPASWRCDAAPAASGFLRGSIADL